MKNEDKPLYKKPKCWCCFADVEHEVVEHEIPLYHDKRKRIKLMTEEIKWTCKCIRHYDTRCLICHRCPEHHRCEAMVAA